MDTKKIKIPKCLYASDEEISEDEADLIPCPPKDIIVSNVPVEPIEKTIKKSIIKEEPTNKVNTKYLKSKTSKYNCEYCCNSFKTQSAMLKHLHIEKCFFKNHEDKLTKEQLKNRDESLRLQLIALGKLGEDEEFGWAESPLKKKEKQVEIIEEPVIKEKVNEDLGEIIKPTKEPKQKPIKEPKQKPIKEKPPKPPKDPKPKQPRQPRQPKAETFNPPPPPPQMQRQQSQQQPRYVFKFN